jgi:predicted transcriptional regulator of viral defense system
MKSIEFVQMLRESEKSVFTINDIAKIIDKSTNYSRLYIHRLEKRGFIKELESGKYAIDDHPFLISSNIVFPSYISFLSGLNYYDLTTQMSNTIFVATIKSKKEMKLSDFSIKFVKLNKSRFFGYKREKFNNKLIFAGEIEKVIADSLFLPEYCPITETFEAIKSRKFYLDRLIDYALRMNSIIVLKRLGYMLELLGIEIHKKVKDKLNNRYDLLNPFLPKSKNINKKWKLTINEGLKT